MHFPSESERSKRATLRELLDQGVVQIHIATPVEGVDLPAHLMAQETVILNLSHRFNLSIFEIGPFEIRANLSFSGQRYLCVIPWRSLFMMRSLPPQGEAASDELMRVYFYQEDAPAALLQRLHAQQRRQQAAAPPSVVSPPASTSQPPASQPPESSQPPASQPPASQPPESSQPPASQPPASQPPESSQPPAPQPPTDDDPRDPPPRPLPPYLRIVK